MAQNVVPRKPVSLLPIVSWLTRQDGVRGLASAAGWLDAFIELITLDQLAVYQLGSKYPGEAAEMDEAWTDYLLAYQIHPEAKHQLNSLWLHAIDESADVLNTHVAWMLYKYQLHNNYVISRGELKDMLIKSLSVMLVGVESITGALERETRFDLCQTVLSMATAKMWMTSLRPHSSDCRVNWGQFPAGGPSE